MQRGLMKVLIELFDTFYCFHNHYFRVIDFRFTISFGASLLKEVGRVSPGFILQR